MKRCYPEIYRIEAGEQLRRLRGVLAAAGSAVAGTESDRWRAPGYLAAWYAGLAWGYLRGPAWTKDRP